MKSFLQAFVFLSTILVYQPPVNAFSLRSLSEKELRSYALYTSRGCLYNTVIDEGAGPADYCSMTIDYIREIMRRRGWSYQKFYQ